VKLPKLLLLLLGGCGGVSQGVERVEMRDLEAFVRDVEPVLEARCANPSCHGRPERPLSLYAPSARRKNPDGTYLAGPLSGDELWHNYAVSCALSAGTPEEALLARKPLGASGGLYHGGGAVFEGPTDRGYRAIIRWLGGEGNR
jgi:hypothetical protein